MAQRWPAVAVGGGVALFWVGDLVGGGLQPGYSFSRDYVSALAGYGARAPWVGVAAIAASGLAHAAAERCVRRVFPGARLAPAALVLAGAATLVVAASRITCVGGAAGCHLPGADATRGWTDALHGAALLGYEAAFVGSAVAVAALAARGGRPPLAAASAAVAIASPYLALTIDEAPPGARERLWVAAGHAWLLAVALVAARTGRRRRGSPGPAQPAR